MRLQLAETDALRRPSPDRDLDRVPREGRIHVDLPRGAPQRFEIGELEDLAALQRSVLDIYVDPSLVSYAVDIATATRVPAAHGLADLAQYISYGASPRGPISLVQGARALALIRGRDYAVPQDLRDLAKDALHHRIVLSYEALAAEVGAESIVQSVLDVVPVPELELVERAA